MADDRSGEKSLTMSVSRQVQTLRVISLALVIGVCTLGMVVLTQSPRQADNANRPGGQPAADPAAPRLGTLSFAAVGLMVFCGVLASVVPRGIVNARLKRLADDTVPQDAAGRSAASEKILAALLQTYQTQHILRGALLEGPAFFGLIAYMIEGHAAVLVVPAVSIGILLASLPSVGKVTTWVEERLAELAAR